MRAVLAILLAILPSGALAGDGAAPLKVAAASDLAGAFEEIGALHRAATGRAVVFSFGSSGLLARRIVEGAPFDLFASADPALIDEAIGSGAALADSREVFALGRVALFPAAGVEPVAGNLSGLAAPRFRRIALANPDHAPYGRAAREAIEKAGLWAALHPRLVFGADARQALQFVRTGNADAALTALSLAGAEDRPVPVDGSLHAVVRHAIVVCSRSPMPADARAFAAVVAGAKGREILSRYGYLAPGGAR